MKTRSTCTNSIAMPDLCVLSGIRRLTFKRISLFFFCFLIALTYFGCKKSPEVIETSSLTATQTAGDNLTGNYKATPFREINLVASRTVNVGTVKTSFNDEGDELTVIYEVTMEGWCLMQTHLDVRVNPDIFPMTPSGNPKVGQFNYGEPLDCVMEWTQVIDLNDIEGWDADATVYVAANAIMNDEEAAWGRGESFPGGNWGMYFSCKASCPASFTYEGQTYATTVIGNQCWMAENLNVGTMIPSHPGGQNQTDNSTIEKYCFNDNPANCDTYGGLYEWDEMMNYVEDEEGARGICPEGWHIPSQAEWFILTDFLGGFDIAGGKLKEEGFTHWDYPNAGATNSTGFTALPGGYRHDESGDTYDMGILCDFWSSTQVEQNDNGTPVINGWRCDLGYDYGYFGLGDGHKTYGFSVRCVKD